MDTLKNILDRFGWEKVQQGQLPTEIILEKRISPDARHRWDLYALNGVWLAVEDKKFIYGPSGIAKTKDGYRRTADIPTGKVVVVSDVPDFLEGFRHIRKFKHPLLYTKEEGTDFNGIGRMIEEAGELYTPNKWAH